MAKKISKSEKRRLDNIKYWEEKYPNRSRESLVDLKFINDEIQKKVPVKMVYLHYHGPNLWIAFSKKKYESSISFTNHDERRIGSKYFERTPLFFDKVKRLLVDNGIAYQESLNL